MVEGKYNEYIVLIPRWLWILECSFIIPLAIFAPPFFMYMMFKIDADYYFVMFLSFIQTFCAINGIRVIWNQRWRFYKCYYRKKQQQL